MFFSSSSFLHLFCFFRTFPFFFMCAWYTLLRTSVSPLSLLLQSFISPYFWFSLSFLFLFIFLLILYLILFLFLKVLTFSPYPPLLLFLFFTIPLVSCDLFLFFSLLIFFFLLFFFFLILFLFIFNKFLSYLISLLVSLIHSTGYSTYLSLSRFYISCSSNTFGFITPLPPIRPQSSSFLLILLYHLRRLTSRRSHLHPFLASLCIEKPHCTKTRTGN